MVGRQANGTLVNGSLYMRARNALGMPVWGVVAVARLETSTERPAFHIGGKSAILVGPWSSRWLLGLLAFRAALSTRLVLLLLLLLLDSGWRGRLSHRFRWIVRAHEP